MRLTSATSPADRTTDPQAIAAVDAAITSRHSIRAFLRTAVPRWVSPYVERRRKVGWDRYGLLGIAKTDKGRMHAQHRRNHEFFGAPVPSGFVRYHE